MLCCVAECLWVTTKRKEANKLLQHPRSRHHVWFGFYSFVRSFAPRSLKEPDFEYKCLGIGVDCKQSLSKPSSFTDAGGLADASSTRTTCCYMVVEMATHERACLDASGLFAFTSVANDESSYQVEMAWLGLALKHLSINKTRHSMIGSSSVYWSADWNPP